MTVGGTQYRRTALPPHCLQADMLQSRGVEAGKTQGMRQCLTKPRQLAANEGQSNGGDKSQCRSVAETDQTLLFHLEFTWVLQAGAAAGRYFLDTQERECGACTGHPPMDDVSIRPAYSCSECS